jgi:hypothetical protein
VIQWQEETEHRKTDETRDAKHAVEQSTPHDNFDRRVFKKESGIESRHDRGISPAMANKWKANCATRSTSVVIKVIICALLENSFSSSSLSLLFPSVFLSFFFADDEAPEEETTSFRTSVFAKSMVLSCVRKRVWTTVVAMNHI